MLGYVDEQNVQVSAVHDNCQVWMVHPNIRPATLVDPESEPTPNGPRPPRVEYLATLSRHSAAVNVVRFSPNGSCQLHTIVLVSNLAL
jgi:hypothetical protein